MLYIPEFDTIRQEDYVRFQSRLHSEDDCKLSTIQALEMGMLGQLICTTEASPLKILLKSHTLPNWGLYQEQVRCDFLPNICDRNLTRSRCYIYYCHIKCHTIQLENQFHRDCFHSEQMNVGQLNITNLLYILIPHYIMSLSPIPLYGCFPNHQHKDHSLWSSHIISAAHQTTDVTDDLRAL